VRVLSLILIFNLFLSYNLFAKKIEGDISEQLKLTLQNYSEKLSKEKFTDILNILGYYIISEDNESITVQKSAIIKSITFKGNLYILNSQLLSIIGVNKGDQLYTDSFYKIRENILNFYKDNGFLDVDVDIEFNDGFVVVKIDEGSRYFVDKIDFIVDGNIITKNIHIKPYSEKIIEDEILSVLKSLQKDLFLGNKVLRRDLIFNGHKRVYFANDPLSSLLSVFKSGVILKPVIYINKGTKYNFNIHGDFLSPSIKEEIKQFFLENFVSFETFDLRELELKIIEFLSSKGFINTNIDIHIDGNKIDIHVDAKAFIKNYSLEIFLNNIKSNDINDDLLKFYISSYEDTKAKEHILDKLKSIGYESAKISDYSINRMSDKITGKIYITTGAIKYINNIYVNKTEYKPKKKYKISQTDIENLRREIIDNYASRCLIKGLNLQKIESDNIFFDLFCDTAEISEIISNSEEIVGKIKKRFFSNDKTFTNKKFEELTDYLLKNKNSEKVYIEPFHVDNDTILVINQLKSMENNRIFGSLSYDSVDKLSFEAGYNRFDILNSSRTLQLSLKQSFLETSVLTSLSGQKTIHRNIDDYIAILYKDRDENDFNFRETAFKTLIRLNVENLKFYIGLSASYLDIYDTDFSLNYEKLYKKNYKVFSIPLRLSYTTENYSSFIGYGLSAILSTTPIFTNEIYSLETKIRTEGFKSIFTNNFLLKGTFELNTLTGEKKKIPATQLYTLGGPQKMKAYRYREIGFKDPQTTATIGNKNILYTNLFLGFKPMDQVIFGPFFEYAGYGDRLDNLEYAKDLGLELIISQQNVGFFSMSYAYAPFNPYKNSSSFYINFGINF